MMMEKNAFHDLMNELDRAGARFLVVWLIAALVALFVVVSVILGST